jgi:peptide/nickel transport system permease protein
VAVLRYLIRRLILSVFVIVAVASVTFFMLFLSGDPVQAMLYQVGATQKDLDDLRHSLGYDRPVLVQYVDFLGKAARGDFGKSIRFGQPAMPLVMERLPYTAGLAAVGLTLSLLVAIPAGLLAAIRPGSLIDRLSILIAVLGQSIPTFVLGVVFILVVAVWLRWLPAAGATTPAHVVLPAITLSLYPMARIARIMRTSMLDVIGLDYVTTARAKGLGERTVMLRHVARNAALPVLTIIGLQLGTMLGGAVIVETIFGWPGIGLFSLQSVLNKDFPLVQAAVTVAATITVLLNLAVDVLYAWADPRIRYA